MKKIIFITVIVMSCSFKLASQSMYYDVLKLRTFASLNKSDQKVKFELKTKKDSLEFCKILGNYIKDSANYNELVTEFNNNPFMKIPKSNSLSTSSAFNPPLLNSGIGALSSIGGVDVTNIADGLAKFLVKRTKQELSATFFEKFKEELNKKELADLRILFPETHKVLNTIGEDIYQYSTYLNTLREVFIKDLNNHYINLQKLLDQQKYKDYFNNTKPELGSILYTSLYFINKISGGVHPGQALKDYNVNKIRLCKTDKDCADSIPQNNIRRSVDILKMLSESFRSKSDSSYWVPADSIQIMLKDEITFNIYMGLIYQTGKDITFWKIDGKPLLFQDILKDAKSTADSLKEYKNYINAFSNKTQTVNDYIKEIKGKTKAERDYNDYYTLFNSSLDLLDHTRTFIDLPYVYLGETQETKIKSMSSAIIFVAESTGELYIDVKTKNYSSAIINTVQILDTIVNYNSSFRLNEINEALKVNKDWLKDKSSIKSEIRKKIIETFSDDVIRSYGDIKVTYSIITKTMTPEVVAAIPDQDAAYVVQYVNLLISKSVAENKAQLRKDVLKYGTFIAGLAQANSSDEVEALIESTVLPSVSARVKRESAWNISINAYCGLYVGSEKQQYRYEEQGAAINSFGFSAPIGIAFSRGGQKFFGLPCKKDGHFSHTLFVSLIDLGAVASFRFQNDTLKTIQKIELKDIVSPGLFYSLGIPKTPLSVNLGYQIAPFLSNVSATTNTTRASYNRFSVSILVDIPLFNLHTKSKN